MIPISIIFSLRQNNVSRVCSGGGTFGCTDTQVQAKIVARHPQTISNSFRQWLILSQESAGARVFRGSATGAALPFLVSRWTRKRRRSIVVFV
jgi:hypothetical protein